MILYTVAPLLDPNAGHAGFWVVFVVAIMFSLFSFIAAALDNADGIGFPVGVTFVMLLACGIAYDNSYNTKLPVPVNEKITATRVGMISEAENKERVGKTYQYVTSAYVTYMTPDGTTQFKVGSGEVWPEKATLYRNIVEK